MTRKVLLMATARRYTMEQIEAARKKLRSLPVKEAGKTRGEVAEFLVNDIKKAMRRGYTLRDIRDVLAEAGISVPLARLGALLGKVPKPQSIADGGETETDTAPLDDVGDREIRTGHEAEEKRRGQGVCPGRAVSRNLWNREGGLLFMLSAVLFRVVCPDTWPI